MREASSGLQDRGFLALQWIIRVIAVTAICLALARDIAFELHPERHTRPYDFRAIYCGEFVTAAGGNPYHSQPLRSCEASLEVKPILPLPNQALPATLPPYAQVAFSGLGHFDSITAQIFFNTLSFVALLLAIYAISQLSTLPLSVITIPLVYGLYVQSSTLGTIAVFAFTGMAYTALFYQAKKYAACAAASTLIMLQPQTGLAVFIALFISEKKMRFPLIGAAFFLLALSLPLGSETIMSYFQALSLHARAEQYQNTQLSLTFFLRQLGASEQTAGAAGSAAYLVWILCVIFFALKRKAQDAFTVLIPAMIAVLPGSFVQNLYLTVALIPALMLIKHGKSTLAFMGMCSLAVVVQTIMKFSLDYYLILSLGGLIAVSMLLFERKQNAWMIPTLSVATLAFCLFFTHTIAAEHTIPVLHPEPTFASTEWYLFRVVQPGPSLDVSMRKVPYLLGLFLILIASLRYTGAMAKIALNEKSV